MSKLTRVRIDYLSEIEGVIYKVMSLTETVPDSVGTILYKGKYVYKRDSGNPIDGINRITTADGNGWLFLTSDAIYASDFCHDTPTLQAAYEFSASKGLDFIIDKVFDNLMATTDDPESVGNLAFQSVIRAVDNSVIRFIGDGALRLARQLRPQSHIIYIHNVSNVTIYNPILVGDRLTNTTVGEHGWGLTILQCNNVRVIGGSYSNMFGDGIYIGMKWGTVNGKVPTNVYIERPIISNCRRNGISLCSGENVRIVQPQIYNIGDSDGIAGAMPKAGIDVEPEADETTPNFTIPRLINCVIDSPYIDTAYTGLELNMFPANLIAELHVTGNCTLKNIQARGVTATRVLSGGIGLVKVDRVVYLTSPIDYAVFEMLGNDRFFVDIGELVDDTTVAGGDRVIRLLPRTEDPIGSGLSNNFSNLTIGKCTTSIGSFIILAGASLANYIIDINIGKSSDKIVPSLSFSQGDTGPGQVRGFIGGVSTVTNSANTKLLCSTILVNNAAQETDILLDATGDFRRVLVQRILHPASIARYVAVTHIQWNGGAGDVYNTRSNSFGCSMEFQNNEGTYTRIFSQFGAWSNY